MVELGRRKRPKRTPKRLSWACRRTQLYSRPGTYLDAFTALFPAPGPCIPNGSRRAIPRPLGASAAPASLSPSGSANMRTCHCNSETRFSEASSFPANSAANPSAAATRFACAVCAAEDSEVAVSRSRSTKARSAASARVFASAAAHARRRALHVPRAVPPPGSSSPRGARGPRRWLPGKAQRRCQPCRGGIIAFFGRSERPRPQRTLIPASGSVGGFRGAGGGLFALVAAAVARRASAAASSAGASRLTPFARASRPRLGWRFRHPLSRRPLSRPQPRPSPRALRLPRVRSPAAFSSPPPSPRRRRRGGAPPPLRARRLQSGFPLGGRLAGSLKLTAERFRLPASPLPSRPPPPRWPRPPPAPSPRSACWRLSAARTPRLRIGRVTAPRFP